MAVKNIHWGIGPETDKLGISSDDELIVPEAGVRTRSGDPVPFPVGLSLAGVTLNATGAELNYNDITTLGTTEASKVVTTDSSGVTAWATMFKIPTATVAATGTVQADAASITTGFTLVTGADDAKGVKLPAAAAGSICIIKVDTGADLKVWPATGDGINAVAVNSNITVVDDVCFALIAYDATTWYTLPLLPS
jgi:hypothetical protein